MTLTNTFAANPNGLDAQLGRDMRGPSLVIWLCGASVLVFLIWAAFAWVDEIVRAEGSMISSSRPQIIQNLEGGILAELSVAEGDIVEKGDVLARGPGREEAAVGFALPPQSRPVLVRPRPGSRTGSEKRSASTCSGRTRASGSG